jgi:hypothetical protein
MRSYNPAWKRESVWGEMENGDEFTQGILEGSDGNGSRFGYMEQDSGLGRYSTGFGAGAGLEHLPRSAACACRYPCMEALG